MTPPEPGSVEAKVMNAIARGMRIDVKNIRLDTTFEDLGLASIDVISILFEIEDAFQIEVPVEGDRDLKSVRDVVERIRPLLPDEA